MDLERLNERTADFLKGVRQREQPVAQPLNEFTRDAVIQRFEFCYELSWKMLKFKLEQEGISALTPRQVLRESLQAALLDDGNAGSEIQRYRNLTGHIHDERLADEVYAFIGNQALARFQALAREVVTWQSQA